ncbi:MAG: hypothetical protein HS120_05355 [Burkholderiales bacterium]|nr:hypothetical protein [Burkholderiales bacterium]
MVNEVLITLLHQNQLCHVLPRLSGEPLTPNDGYGVWMPENCDKLAIRKEPHGALIVDPKFRTVIDLR